MEDNAQVMEVIILMHKMVCRCILPVLNLCQEMFLLEIKLLVIENNYYELSQFIRRRFIEKMDSQLGRLSTTYVIHSQEGTGISDKKKGLTSGYAGPTWLIYSWYDHHFIRLGHIESNTSILIIRIQVRALKETPVSLRIITRCLIEWFLVSYHPLIELSVTSTHRDLPLELCHIRPSRISAE